MLALRLLNGGDVMYRLERNRMKLSEKRTHKITVRLNDNDYDNLKITAQKLNLSMSNCFRLLLLDKLPTGFKSISLDNSDLIELLNSITKFLNLENTTVEQSGRIGNNINQIANSINSGIDVDFYADDLKKLIQSNNEKYIELIERLKKIDSEMTTLWQLLE